MQKIYKGIFRKEESINDINWKTKLYRRVYRLDIFFVFAKFPRVSKSLGLTKYFHKHLSTNLLQILQRRSVLWHTKFKTFIKIGYFGVYPTVYLRTNKSEAVYTFLELMSTNKNFHLFFDFLYFYFCYSSICHM